MKKILKTLSNSEQKRLACVRNILAFLTECPNCNVNMVAEAVDVNWMTAKRKLDVLEGAGVVEKNMAFREYLYRLVAR